MSVMAAIAKNERNSFFPMVQLFMGLLGDLRLRGLYRLEKLVRENAEAVDCGGFCAEDNRAECDRDAAMAFCQGNFIWGEVAFGTDKNRNAFGGAGVLREKICQDRLHRAGVRLERGNEEEFGLIAAFEEGFWRGWCRDFGEVILPALLAGFDRDVLPLGALLFGLGGSELNDCAVGKKRSYTGGAKLDRFLDDKVHIFTLRNSLREGDRTRRRWSMSGLG